MLVGLVCWSVLVVVVWNVGRGVVEHEWVHFEANSLGVEASESE